MSKESSGVKGKRCLFLTNYFYPEVFRGNDIAFEMVKRGYEVTVITCIPNYPQGHFTRDTDCGAGGEKSSME